MFAAFAVGLAAALRTNQWPRIDAAFYEALNNKKAISCDTDNAAGHRGNRAAPAPTAPLCLPLIYRRGCRLKKLSDTGYISRK